MSINEENDSNEILRVRREKLTNLQATGHDPFAVTEFDVSHHAKEIIENFKQMDGREVSIAGRMMSRRVMGKAMFSDIADQSGNIQLYISVNDMNEKYEDIKKLDIGDMIGIRGTVFRTKRGEISVHVNEVILLAKSLQPLPEKFHGLKDTDLRYRRRYVDLIVNPDEIRHFLDTRGFLEIDTPVLDTIAGGANARPFITHHNTLNIDMYLRIATELHLKRLIVGGFERVYELGRNFRNEGMSIKHNPEFTTVEVYKAYTNYIGMMELTEDLISTIAENVLGTTKVVYQGEEINLAPGWTKLTMIDAVKQYAGVDFNVISTDEEAQAAAKEIDVEVKADATWGSVLNESFEEKVEENLLSPTFIIDYPVEISPLAKRKLNDPRLTERFELFITRREMANAFSELNDPIDQRERFVKQVAARAAGDDEAHMMDDDFILALEYGLPPTGGMGMGVERLCMLLTDSASIKDVLLFPTMKPLE